MRKDIWTEKTIKDYQVIFLRITNLKKAAT